MAPRVMTVTGPIPPENVGFTLPHEHTGLSLWHIPGRWDHWQLSADEELLGDELRDARRRGAATLVDLTVAGIGRDPARLRRLASRTGLQIVMGCGWYTEPYHPAEARIAQRSVADLAAELIGEFERGIGEAGIRPGIIGEIGVEKAWVSPAEERVHRAAARASRATGMAIVTHGVGSPVGADQLRILVDEGADPERVVIGHADTHPDFDHWLALLDTGASLAFDNLQQRSGAGEAREARLIELIVELLERGFASQLLLSQDVCHDQQLKANGGSGYTYLQQQFLPKLRTAAVGEGEIVTMTVDNPRRLLTLP